MEVCGYTPFAQSFKAFSVETIHLALNIGIDVKMITSNELVIGKKNGHRLGGSYEQKYDIVMRLQQITHICGMAGDDVSDTPVLKKASIGIATDVACGASDIVLLIEPGLNVIVSAVLISRAIFQRMENYMLFPLLSKLCWDLCFLLLFGNLISRLSWI